MSEFIDTNREANPLEGETVSVRRPMRAVVLTLLVTGLGHVYCGELAIGLIWAAVGALCGVVSLWAIATQVSSVGVASLPLWIVSVAAAVHVWYSARNCPVDYRLKSYNRWYVYVSLFVISSLGVAGHGLVVRTGVVEAYVTPANNMSPTLRAGDRFLVDKTAYRNSMVKIGHLAVFKSPAEPRRVFVSRVVAMEGDSVEIRDGQLLVNGREIGQGDPAIDDFGPTTVPPYNCFVLGDNRGKSRDSRHFGPVPHVGILGKATILYWPQESWSRFGWIE